MVKSLQDEVKALKTADPGHGGVTASLALVRNLIAAPRHLRDTNMIMSALQQLADDARIASDPKTLEYEAILRQCRPLLYRGETWGTS